MSQMAVNLLAWMEYRPLASVPTNVIRALPLEPDLQVVVLVDQIQEPAKQLGALLLGHAVDVLDVAAHRENGLPAGYRVGADDRVDGLELGANVLGGAAGLVV